MNRSRDHVTPYYHRDLSIHKPGVIPHSSRIVSPITSHRHKHELKQRIGPKKSVESWFATHSQDDRRAVYSFLDTLYRADETNGHDQPRRKSSSANQRLPRRTSQRELGEVLESLESLNVNALGTDKPAQAASAVQLPDVNATKNDHPATPAETHATGDGRASRRYLSQTWRVINPREDVEQNVRPDMNTSSFFKYTKKTYPEYFFIHPDWY